MNVTLAVAERRRFRRNRLELPVRLRWLTPLGTLTEEVESRETSRGGLLASTSQEFFPGSMLWVLFPFDPAAEFAVPETPARVARMETATGKRSLVAVEFLRKPHDDRATYIDRRAKLRTRIAVPVQVRAGGGPWPEETMTADLSDAGAAFWTLRAYEAGQAVTLRLPNGWRGAGRDELPARVVHVSLMADLTEARVGVAFVRKTPSRS